MRLHSVMFGYLLIVSYCAAFKYIRKGNLFRSTLKCDLLMKRVQDSALQLTAVSLERPLLPVYVPFKPPAKIVSFSFAVIAIFTVLHQTFVHHLPIIKNVASQTANIQCIVHSLFQKVYNLFGNSCLDKWMLCELTDRTKLNDRYALYQFTTDILLNNNLRQVINNNIRNKTI